MNSSPVVLFGLACLSACAVMMGRPEASKSFFACQQPKRDPGERDRVGGGAGGQTNENRKKNERPPVIDQGRPLPGTGDFRLPNSAGGQLGSAGW